MLLENVHLMNDFGHAYFFRYWIPLARAVQDQHFCLVQPLLSSSLQGYGTSSLDKDADELDMLLSCLKLQYASQVRHRCNYLLMKRV
jgi:hypothetical protein